MLSPVATEIIDLARRIASEHGLDPALVCAVVEQESSWNPWAVRYEPGFLSRYVAPLYTAGKLSATDCHRPRQYLGEQVITGTLPELPPATSREFS